MSMNIFITATRNVTFKKKNGKVGEDTQTVKFNAWQTPTIVTRQILASDDCAQAYINWVLTEFSEDEEVNVYADDDVFCEGEPIGVGIINEGKEHVQEFKDWMFDVQENGFTVTFEEI